MTPRNMYAIGLQPCETMVCKFPLPRVKTSVSAIVINPCWSCARSIICSEFAATTGTLILGRPSGSCVFFVFGSYWENIRKDPAWFESRRDLLRLVRDEVVVTQ